jgi:iron(III) transport system ATP-binding protein
MPEIALQGVRKEFGAGPPAVADLTLTVPDGAFMCLLGPSGCGKTTTLRMIAGLEHPTAGRIAIGARLVSAVGEGVFVPPEQRNLGLVFQSYALWPHLSVARNVDFGLRLRRMPRARREQHVASMLERLGIAAQRDRYPSQLSGGQQQRVALARMLAVNPDVLLMDEPLSNLDARLRLEMRAELKRLHAEFATTIVFVTHDQWEAMTLATEIAVMSEGALQQVAAPDVIYTRPATRFVAEFVGNPPINMVELQGGTALGRGLCAFLERRAPAVADAASVGLRPDALRLAPEPAAAPADAFVAPASVTGVLPTGGSWILELACEDAKLFQLAHAPPDLAGGAQTWVWAEAGALHVFDSHGRRIPAADAALPGLDGTAARETARAAG